MNDGQIQAQQVQQGASRLQLYGGSQSCPCDHNDAPGTIRRQRRRRSHSLQTKGCKQQKLTQSGARNQWQSQLVRHWEHHHRYGSHRHRLRSVCLRVHLRGWWMTATMVCTHNDRGAQHEYVRMHGKTLGANPQMVSWQWYPALRHTSPSSLMRFRAPHTSILELLSRPDVGSSAQTKFRYNKPSASYPLPFGTALSYAYIATHPRTALWGPLPAPCRCSLACAVRH
jgi:hypothetical protein